jgi:hypothetical protein
MSQVSVRDGGFTKATSYSRQSAHCTARCRLVTFRVTAGAITSIRTTFTSVHKCWDRLSPALSVER